MKNKIIAIGMSVAVMFTLGACARSGNQAGAGSGASGTAGSTSAGSVSGQDAGAENSGSGQIGNDGAASLDQGAIGNDGAASLDQGAIGNDGAASLDQGAIGNDGAASLDGSAEQGAEDSGTAGEAQVEPDATYDALNQSGDTGAQTGDVIDGTWDGSFASDAGETLITSQTDESTLTFSFGQSEISGSAAINGEEAVYNGDDGNIVVFKNSGDSMVVSVTDADGTAIEAVISGIFSRE